MPPDRNEMARLHEDALAELNGGRSTRGSGQTWQDPADGRSNRLTEPEFAFAWDGKSTRGKSLTIDRPMIDKIREQAGGERPQIGLRWYDTDDLQRVGEDWIAIPAADFAELLATARLQASDYAGAVAEAIAGAQLAAQQQYTHTNQVPQAIPLPPSPPAPLPPGRLGGPYPAHRLPVPPHELWPCLVVDGQHDEESTPVELTHRGYWIADDGTVREHSISSVRYDDGTGETRLYVNDIRVHRGQLYVDGQLRVQVGGPPGVTS